MSQRKTVFFFLKTVLLSEKTARPFSRVVRRKTAEVTMDGQFLVRQIYDDEITYNLVSSAAQILSECTNAKPPRRAFFFRNEKYASVNNPPRAWGHDVLFF